MPPSSTLPTQQLATLTASLKQTSALITRLAQLSFQPGSEPLSDSSENNTVRVELSQDIREGLAQVEEDLELLKGEIEDDDTSRASGTPLSASGNIRGSGYLTRSARANSTATSTKVQERERAQTQLAKLSADLKTARATFRRAQISAKKAADNAKSRERELVFASLRQPPADPSTPVSASAGGDLFAHRSQARRGQQKQLTKDELLVSSATDVTTALRRTHDLLSTELSRSRFAQETFEQSTQALQGLGERYEGLEGVLGKSRELLGTLLRSQKSDTWYLETAFYLLLATLCWLFFRRVLFGPFVKLPLFLWRLGVFALNWVVVKPLVGFLWVTGVFTTEPVAGVGKSSNAAEVSVTRKPLIVHNSATNRPPAYTGTMADQAKAKGMPAGAGGAGAKVGKEGVLAGEMSEDIGRLAEEGGTKGEEPVRRGDGTILEDRGEVPKNPKKRVLEDGGEAVSQNQDSGSRKRDEL